MADIPGLEERIADREVSPIVQAIVPPVGGHWGAVRAKDLCELRRFLHKVATWRQWDHGSDHYLPIDVLEDLASEAEELLSP